jgi:raffinose/stachyose/melibiose transport system permease protein
MSQANEAAVGRRNHPLGLLGRLLLNLIFIVFSITCVYPIFWIFYSSLKTQAEFAMASLPLPKAPTLVNYISVFTQTKMPLFVFNTARVTFFTVFLTILFAFIFGYMFSRYSFKGKGLLYTFILIGMLVPIHALLVPIYVQLNGSGLANSWFTLILPYVAFGIPFATILIESFIGTIPRTFEEAAAIDGSSFIRTLFTIILPLAMPVIATIAIIQFFASWNEFSFSLILISKESLRTIQVGLTSFKTMYTTDYPRLMAGMMVGMAPVMIIYFIFSDRIIKGMMAGAIKG